MSMPQMLHPQVLVLGGGPGGYVAAIRAGQLGLDTVLVDAERPGGTCLLRGCIPSKALIHAADTFAGMTAAASGGNALGIAIDAPPRLDLARTVAWKDGIVDRLASGVGGLLKRAKVTVVEGWAQFSDAKSCTVDTAAGPVAIAAEHVILAAGSEPAALPALPFGGDVISSTDALALDQLPRQLVVVGAGYIGLELGIAFKKLGAAVTIVELADRILPRYDDALTRPVRRWLNRAGVELHLGATVTGPEDGGVAIESAQGRKTLAADKILVTIGRRPRTRGWGLKEMALDMAGPFVKVDDQCRTAMRNVWAIGDLVGEPMLAHKAMAQGAMVAEIIAGRRRHFDPASVAAIVFSEPEIVVAGMLPDDATAAGIETSVALFPFAASGRALTLGAGTDGGFVRIIARRDDDRILGIQAVGRQVAELAGEFSHALAMGAVLDDLAHTIHVHPTLGEAVGEAALVGLGRGLHA
jgi:dihydrolipoamide dehydrogenase